MPRTAAAVWPKGENKYFEGRLSKEALAFDAVEVGKDEVDGVLRKVVEGFAFGNDVAEHGVVFLTVGLLAGLVGVAKKEQGFFPL